MTPPPRGGRRKIAQSSEQRIAVHSERGVAAHYAKGSQMNKGTASTWGIHLLQRRIPPGFGSSMINWSGFFWEGILNLRTNSGPCRVDIRREYGSKLFPYRTLPHPSGPRPSHGQTLTEALGVPDARRKAARDLCRFHHSDHLPARKHPYQPEATHLSFPSKALLDCKMKKNQKPKRYPCDSSRGTLVYPGAQRLPGRFSRSLVCGERGAVMHEWSFRRRTGRWADGSTYRGKSTPA